MFQRFERFDKIPNSILDLEEKYWIPRSFDPPIHRCGAVPMPVNLVLDTVEESQNRSKFNQHVLMTSRIS